MVCSPEEMSGKKDSTQTQRELIRQLEAKNREISQEIQKLKEEQEKQAAAPGSGQNTPPAPGGQSGAPGGLLTELQQLRERKDELEGRMSALQESRKDLVTQLETLMKLLKNHSSPRLTPHSTPASSPRCRAAQSPPPPPPSRPPGAVPGSGVPADSLTGVGGDVREAFCHGSVGRSLRNDLLTAADSVTNAMSSLVKELHSEASSGSDDDIERTKETATEVDEFARWQQEVEEGMRQESDFLRELRARKQPASERRDTRDGSYTDISSDDTAYSRRRGADNSYQSEDSPTLHPRQYSKGEPLGRYVTDEDSCLETDQESYIRTDDEDGSNTEWEEGMRRWVNR